MALQQATKKAKPLIAPYTNLLSLRVEKNGVKAFSVRFRNTHTYFAHSCRMMDQKNSAVGALYLQRWAQRTEPLWWSVISFSKTFDTKRTMKSWAARKLRIAFTESLERHGYAPDGTRLPGSEGKPIVATVQISPNPPIFKTSCTDLATQMDSAVKVIIAEARKNGGGKNSTKRVSSLNVVGRPKKKARLHP